MDEDQPFTNLESDLAYFKAKETVIIFGDMNAHKRTYKLDQQQSFMPHISRMQEDIQIYSHPSMD